MCQKEYRCGAAEYVGILQKYRKTPRVSDRVFLIFVEMARIELACISER